MARFEAHPSDDPSSGHTLSPPLGWSDGPSATLVLAGCSGPSGVLRPTTTTTTTASTTSTTSTTGPHSRTESPGAVPAGRPAWIVSESAVALLREAGLSRHLVAYFFNNTNTFLLLSGPEHIRRELPLARATESFTSYAALKHAFAINAISAGTRAILYDNENWSLTPLPERAQPILYAARAEALVHRHHMKFVFTPASDLADAHVRSPGAGGSSYQRYLEQDLAGRGARVSDVFEIQSQQIEGTSAFLPFATLATAQAKAANPDAMLLLGIGTNPGGRSVTARALLQCIPIDTNQGQRVLAQHSLAGTGLSFVRYPAAASGRGVPADLGPIEP